MGYYFLFCFLFQAFSIIYIYNISRHTQTSHIYLIYTYKLLSLRWSNATNNQGGSFHHFEKSEGKLDKANKQGGKNGKTKHGMDNFIKWNSNFNNNTRTSFKKVVIKAINNIIAKDRAMKNYKEVDEKELHDAVYEEFPF